MNKVAVSLTNYNMPERADAIAQHLENFVDPERYDLYLVDNGSDLVPMAEHTTVIIPENKQTTGGWLEGLKAADDTGIDYFAYWFIGTSIEFVDCVDPLTPLVEFLEDNDNAVGIHPVLTLDSTTIWKHMYITGEGIPRRVHMIDNIASLYRADWFNKIGRFDPALYMAHGMDLETGWKARKEGRSIWMHEGIRIRKVTDIGYAMNRMNMTSQERLRLARANMDDVLGKRYGMGYWERLLKEYPL